MIDCPIKVPGIKGDLDQTKSKMDLKGIISDGVPVTLADLIAKKSLKVKDGNALAEALCDLVDGYHSRGKTVGDLSPEFIDVQEDGALSFRDSSLSFWAERRNPDPHYSAPEVRAGGTPDIRSDVFSLGVILWELPGRRRDVVERCCETEPGKRYASAAEVKRALRRSALSGTLAGIAFILLLIVFTILGLKG